MNLDHRLAAAAKVLGLDLEASVRMQMLDYLRLLEKWNAVHNLTAVRALDDMVTLHLLDSLAVVPHVPSGRVLDVGSGAGFPGIPLALSRPDVQVTVLDSSHKKASFMRQVRAMLGMTHLEVCCERVERHRPAQPYDVIITRAFSSIEQFLKLTSHVGGGSSQWMAMKGAYPTAELSSVTGAKVKVVPLHVPGLDAQRHLVIITSTGESAA